MGCCLSCDCCLACSKSCLRCVKWSYGGYRSIHTDGLDLSYIPNNPRGRIVAMCMPSEGMMGTVIRNPLKKVATYLNQRHGKHYRVYNLLETENMYKRDGFKGSFRWFPCPDHQPPTFNALLDFCMDATAYLKKDLQRVIVVHCKAGKGRTGVFIACFLLYSAHFSRTNQTLSVQDALDLYTRNRSESHHVTRHENGQSYTVVQGRGVENPSQMRWVYAFDELLKMEGRKALVPLSTQLLVVKLAVTVPLSLDVVFQPVLLVKAWDHRDRGNILAKVFERYRPVAQQAGQQDQDAEHDLLPESRSGSPSKILARSEDDLSGEDERSFVSAPTSQGTHMFIAEFNLKCEITQETKLEVWAEDPFPWLNVQAGTDSFPYPREEPVLEAAVLLWTWIHPLFLGDPKEHTLTLNKAQIDGLPKDLSRQALSVSLSLHFAGPTVRQQAVCNGGVAATPPLDIKSEHYTTPPKSKNTHLKVPGQNDGFSLSPGPGLALAGQGGIGALHMDRSSSSSSFTSLVAPPVGSRQPPSVLLPSRQSTPAKRHYSLPNNHHHSLSARTPPRPNLAPASLLLSSSSFSSSSRLDAQPLSLQAEQGVALLSAGSDYLDNNNSQLTQHNNTQLTQSLARRISSSATFHPLNWM
eukprot:gb/GEZN01003685.1/.p1 GENE.gb/GEZN01003685.1/~~gb/GEZN01003685.1/.p1  ORF type:complete len:638 (+),score=100.82 gb/GEZN01003685.1/:85-1998(+)